MAQNIKKFCIYDGEFFAVIPVADEATPEEFQNISLRVSPKCITDKNIIPAAVPARFINRDTLVSIGPMLYSVGGIVYNEQMEMEPTNQVTKFDPAQPEVKLESCCNLIQPRHSPALISIGGIIYAFGGLATDIENCKECPWAEFLDTNKPIKEQKWKALNEPILRLSLSLQPCAIRYDAENILIIGCTEIGEGAVLYNVANESSKVYNCSPMPWFDKVDPVNIFEEKTIYWIGGPYLFAYELDKKIGYLADMNDSVLPHFNRRFWNTLQGPVLVHLKDNLFNIFSVFSGSYHERNIIVECTKFRVTKGNKNPCSPRSADRVLHLDLLGYQYYRCDLMLNLWGAVPICT